MDGAVYLDIAIESSFIPGKIIMCASQGGGSFRISTCFVQDVFFQMAVIEVYAT